MQLVPRLKYFICIPHRTNTSEKLPVKLGKKCIRMLFSEVDSDVFVLTTKRISQIFNFTLLFFLFPSFTSFSFCLFFHSLLFCSSRFSGFFTQTTRVLFTIARMPVYCPFKITLSIFKATTLRIRLKTLNFLIFFSLEMIFFLGISILFFALLFYY